MLKFERSNNDINLPYDMGLLDGLSDPVVVVNEKYYVEISSINLANSISS